MKDTAAQHGTGTSERKAKSLLQNTGALVLVLCCLLVPSACLSATRVYLQWLPQAQFAGFIMAEEKGFFAKHGLPHVQLLWASLGESSLRALMEGEAEYATAWLLTAMQRCGTGYPLVNIAQFHQRSGSLLLARKDHGIHKLQDLNGKVLLSWGGDFASEFQHLLQRSNTKPAKILPLSDTLAPFLSGLVSGMQAMEYNEYYKVLERGMQEEDLTVFRLADMGFNFAGDGLYTTEQHLRSHAQEAKALRAAVMEGWDYAFANEDETIGVLLRYGDSHKLPSNSSHQRHMLRTMYALMQSSKAEVPTGSLCQEDFDHVRDLLTEQGLPLQNLLYTSFHTLP